MTPTPSTKLSTEEVHNPPAAIILAAGRGARMGSVKALMPWGDRSLLAAWIARFSEVGCSRIVVVLGHQAEAIRAGVDKDLDITWVINPDVDETGPRESLLLAFDQLAEGEEAWFTPVDVPVVSSDVLHRTQSAYREALEADTEGPPPLAALPCYRRTHGHPVLAGPDFLARLSEGERGDRIDAVFSWATRRLVTVNVSDVRVVGNMNRMTDYQAYAPPAGTTWDWNPQELLDEQTTQIPGADSTLEIAPTIVDHSDS